MSLKEQLSADLKLAMKTGNEQQKIAIRMLLSAIRNAEVEQQQELDDAGIQAVVTKQIKQRKDAIAQFRTGGREDLAAQEAAELTCLERYAAAQMSEAEITELAQKIIADVGATHPKHMGLVMKNLMPQVKGKADGNIVNQVVRGLLTE